MSALQDYIQGKIAQGEKVLSIYLTAGYPSLKATGPLLLTLAKAGADLIELGVPFSDPLADGPTIQAASQKALAEGTTLEKTLNILAEFKKMSQIPVLLMGYANPFMQFGWEWVFDRAAEAGAAGFIIPDLPPEESEAIEVPLNKANLDLIYLISPNTTAERVALIDGRCQSFLYAVSVTGVTGARERLPVETEIFLRRLQRQTRHPVLVGFGVSDPETAYRLSRLCDGVIVGSAVINQIQKAHDLRQAQENLFQFVSGMKEALAG